MRGEIEKVVKELIRVVIEQAEKEKPGGSISEKTDCINGQLNFAFFKTLKEIFSSWFPPSYAGYSKAVSILECCKGEFERTILFPYENKKREENGEV